MLPSSVGGAAPPDWPRATQEAARWEPLDSGLLGPVTLTPVRIGAAPEAAPGP